MINFNIYNGIKGRLMGSSDTKKSACNTPEVLKQWVEDYSDRLYAWAHYKTSDRNIAEDLVQDTFLEAVRSFERFKGKSQPQTWLFSILNYKIIDHYRKEFRNPVKNQSSLASTGNNTREEGIGIYFDDDDRWKMEARPQPWDMDEEHVLDNPDFRVTLQQCMHALPTHWFSAVQLKYLEEKKGKEICQDLDISPSNFWQILHRARLQLRKCLEDHWFKKKAMNKTLQKLMLSCRKATELIEKKASFRLSFPERMQLLFHTSMCSACKTYQKQSRFVDRILEEYTTVKNLREETVAHPDPVVFKKSILEKINREN